MPNLINQPWSPASATENNSSRVKQKSRPFNDPAQPDATVNVQDNPSQSNTSPVSGTMSDKSNTGMKDPQEMPIAKANA